jgi:cardiolipin synthase
MRGLGQSCASCLLLILAGCQAAPWALPSQDNGCRKTAIVEQVLHDTAAAAVHEPATTAGQALCDLGHGSARAVHDLISKRLLLRFCPSPGPLVPERPCLDAGRLDADLARVTGTPAQPVLIELDFAGQEAFLRLQRLIQEACRRIDVLMYLWDPDALGWTVAEALAERAREGVEVRIVVDGGGNLIHGVAQADTPAKVNSAVAWLAGQPGVRLFRGRNVLAHFDHRKLVIFDDRVAWSGGRNFTLTAFFENRDLSFTFRGPLVRQAAQRFEQAWRRAGGPPGQPLSGDDPDIPGWNARARLVETNPPRKTLARSLYRAVDRARHHVYLENPYFTDATLLCKLVEARQRGADVRVVFARDSQSNILDRATKITVNRMLRRGIRVYYHPGVTHAKVASVDGRWAYLGTGNYDNLSFRRNSEIGLAVDAGPIVALLEEKLFQSDFRPEWEVKEPLPVNLGDLACELLASWLL